MKGVTLYVLLAILAVTLSACSGHRRVAANAALSIDSPYVGYYEADGYRWSIPPRYLYSENSKFAVDRWRTGIDSSLYFSPKHFIEAEYDDFGLEGLRQLCFQNLIDSAVLKQDWLDCCLPNGWSERLCDYVAFAEYIKADIEDSVNGAENSLTSEDSDSIRVDNIIGRLVVTAVITSVGDSSCNIPIKLLDLKLSELTHSPVRDGLFLYLAQENNDLCIFRGIAFLPKRC